MAGLMRIALSHVSFVMGFGSSCSQPLLANRPSSTDGSFRKTISIPATGADGDAPIASVRTLTLFDANAESDTAPSYARASLQASRKCASGICQWHNPAVSSSYRLKWTRVFTLPLDSAKL